MRVYNISPSAYIVRFGEAKQLFERFLRIVETHSTATNNNNKLPYELLPYKSLMYFFFCSVFMFLYVFFIYFESENTNNHCTAIFSFARKTHTLIFCHFIPPLGFDFHNYNFSKIHTKFGVFFFIFSGIKSQMQRGRNNKNDSLSDILCNNVYEYIWIY